MEAHGSWVYLRLGFHSWDWGFIHVPIVVKSIDWFWEEKIFDHCIFAHVLFWLLIRSTRPANDKIYVHNEISIYFSFVYINFCCLCSCQSFRQQGTVETWCKRDEEFSRHLNLRNLRYIIESNLRTKSSGCFPVYKHKLKYGVLYMIKYCTENWFAISAFG